MLVPISSGDSSQTDELDLLTSQTTDGIWINETLSINGSTTLNPQNADWVLYDVTDPYVEWPILRSGDFFTTVTPVDEGIWIWTLLVDVQGLNCTCWLEIGQPNGLGKEFLNRIIFIGEGPHNPVISPLHENTIIVDEPVEISTRAVLSDSEATDSEIILSWCYAPNGACDGVTNSRQIDVVWDDNVGSFSINATELDLVDGVWKFNYSLQDIYLKVSPEVTLTVYVDHTAPNAVLISPQVAFEGEELIIDGSGSTDGVWNNNLQYVWYITKPNGAIYVPSTSGNEGVLNIALNDSGMHTIRLDVIDWVGRIDSSNATVQIDNLNPEINFGISGMDVSNPKTWQFVEGENISLHPTVLDSGDDSNSLLYSWYVDGEFVSESTTYSIRELDPGVYDIVLIVLDDDGANATHEIEITVKSENESEPKSRNIGAVVVLFGIIAFSIVIFRRMRTTDNESTSLPKWKQTSSNEKSETDSSDNEERRLWD